MIIFKCDFCKFESNDSGDIKEVNIIQVAACLNGKSQPSNEMLQKGKNQVCNACYKDFIAWVDGELRNWVKSNFPLGKPQENANAG